MSKLWECIDLNHHGIIEAHAGTGKTFTIVKLVVQMLQKTITDEAGKYRRIHIREILLVTFTEKAAGELKKRIRNELKECIASLSPSDPLYEHYTNCLNTLHEALIGTIHSICLRLLQSWPFESGVHFDTDIVDDLEGLKSVLRESMRSDWQEDGSAIPWALQCMAEQGKMPDDKQFTLIRKIAKELLNDTYVMLDRVGVGYQTLSELRSEYEKNGKQKEKYHSSFNNQLELFTAALKEVKESGMLKPDKENLCRIRIGECREMVRTGSYQLKILRKPINFGNAKIFGKKETGKISGTSAVEECISGITDHHFLSALQNEQNIINSIPLALICDAAEYAAHRWTAAKHSEGLISYQDMLRLMHQAVTTHPAFCLSLREKIRYAIIDEFQDTSRLQWEVFRHLFVENGGTESTCLYIVGDPKQSIYAFQGADVNSYLDARNIIKNKGGKQYYLESNYRSLETTVAGYNAVFIPTDKEKNWFLFDNNADGIQYQAHQAVTTPERESQPQHQLGLSPVQVMVLGGSKAKRMKTMAQDTANVIQQLVGTALSVPDGMGWKNINLRYSDFAVIIETHRDARVFLDEFRRKKIPAVKYKMEGVFQSSMARALHVLLLALLTPPGIPAARTAVLLTPFFNRKPEAIDPDHDLEPCDNPACKGDSLCIAHAFEEWTGLAARSFWAQLFESIQHRTGIRERLLCLGDGERHLADLRQIVDYCLECLYQNNYTLVHLTEHLKRLLEGDAVGGEDLNLHVLETERASVRVLTMHAAKGLEFPVVFVVTGGSKKVWKGPDFIRYVRENDNNNKKQTVVSIAPYLSVNDIQAEINERTPEQCYLSQVNQERRRLLYVALTRAQALLYVPVYLDKLPDPGSSLQESVLKESIKYDRDLTPKLLDLIELNEHKGSIALYDEKKLLSFSKRISRVHTDQSLTMAPIAPIPDMTSLNVVSRISRQTSYSQLSRQAFVAREVDKSEEVDEAENERVEQPVLSSLPGGTATGDALHCALEEILSIDEISSVISSSEKVQNIVAAYLKRNGILARLQRISDGTSNVVENAVNTACRCITGALTANIVLPGGEMLKGVVALPRNNRHPEMEFLLKHGPHWVNGFMDLVFRINNPSSQEHPWRYFVLDWKSDSLPDYNEKNINRCIRNRHYDLQAQLYAHALDRYLSGVLGDTYDPVRHLGGAVYLFLREHEKAVQKQATVWTYTARPADDERFIRNKIKTVV